MFLNLFWTDERVFCKACGKAVPCERKFQATQHVATEMHKRNYRKLQVSKLSQVPLTQSFAGTSKQSEQQIFNTDLCKAMVTANIPLKKLQNPRFRQFLEKYCEKSIPDESLLRKCYVTHIYSETINSIREIVKNESIYFTVDETTDSCGRYTANLLIDHLNNKHPGRSYLIACKQLEKTNHLTILRFVNESFMNFFLPDVVPTGKILVMLSDAAAYMIKAGQQLKLLYPNLIGVTCLAHGLNRLAEEIRQ